MPHPEIADTTLSQLLDEVDITPGKLAVLLSINPGTVRKLIANSLAPIYITGSHKGELKSEVIAISDYFNIEAHELFPNFFKAHYEPHRLYHINNRVKISSSKFAENCVFTKELINKLKKRFPKYTNMFDCLAYGKCTKFILEEENITHQCFTTRLKYCRDFLMGEVSNCDDTEYC